MRKLSFLSLSVILMLIFSGCTKEGLNSHPVENPQNHYLFSYSDWIIDSKLSWSDGVTTEPSRQSELAAPELTQQMLDDGSIVLIYAKSNINDSEQIMPAEFSDLNNNETNVFSASHVPGSISLSHTRFINGTFEVPDDSNGISFRYIIVNPNTPDPNARQITIDAFLFMSYKEVVDLLGIPK